MTARVLTEFVLAMHAKSIVPTEPVLATGSLHRFHIEGDSPANKNGWAILHLGEHPHGYYGSWRTGKKHFWQSKMPLTRSEQEAAAKYRTDLQVKHQAEQEKRHAQAAESAKHLIDQAGPADPQHPYLREKQVMPHGILSLEDALLIPMAYDHALTSIQIIYVDGRKQFLPGGQSKGCCFVLDNDPLFKNTSGEIVICEGFATAATLKESYPTVICAFTAANLIPVAVGIRASCPSAKITIAADNDVWTEGNPGLTKARLAAGLTNADVIWPSFKELDTSTKPTDFNDFVRLGGKL